LGRSVYTIKKSTETLAVASRETGLETNAGKTKYTALSTYYNAGLSHNIKIDNSLFESVEEPKHLGITLMNQNSIREENRR
jgi:hypothetical protein